MNLDEALRDASAEAHRATSLCAAGEPPIDEQRRHALPVVVTIAALVGLVGWGLSAQDTPDRLIAAPAAELPTGEGNLDKESTDPVTAQAPRLVTAAVPDGLSLDYSGPVSELGEPIGTETRWIYGATDRAPGANHLPTTITVLTGAPTPYGLIDGRDVDVNGLEGRVLSGGSGNHDTVMFFAQEAAVFVHDRSDDVVEFARSISVGSDGTIIAPTTTPSGLVRLGSFDESFFPETDGAVPADAEVTSYRQGFARYINLVTRPRTPELDRMHEWAIPGDVEIMSIGGRTFTLVDHSEQSGAPSSLVTWMSDDIIGRALSYGIERDELEQALALMHIDGQEPTAVPSRDVDATAVASPTSDQAVLGDNAFAAHVPDGMVILNAVDHQQLGSPDWSSEQYLYGPADATEPDATSPVLLLTVSRETDGLLRGEPIRIAGHEGVIVDKVASNSTADIEFRAGDTVVQVTGRANVELDSVIAAGEQYAQWVMGGGGFNLGAPSSVGIDLDLLEHESIGAWFSEDVNGPFEGTTIVYGEADTTSSGDSARLIVSVTTPANRTVQWLHWMHPGETAIIRVTPDVDVPTGRLVRPQPGVHVLRFEADGRVVQVTATDMEVDEVVAFATSLFEAMNND